ncbi:type I restriction enzyme M protein [Pustulibacterium marinum]|uniref:Type I restriction enzyme M protein n=1 Tax=Pustulibacterium marinum TaxID=1224947 RepID=A0A1I7GKQ5_9FLAO|nr:N-6 DNA methylase [Pustulibacterium marinum]SFU49040.1 type I restriction enzyme M protein [Pustulibacterium marinum]
MSNKALPVPQELKEFNSCFFEFEYKHDLNRVFEDFLTIVICCYGFGTNEDLYFETIKPYSKEELNKFAKLLALLMGAYGEAHAKNEWIDPLGNYYEFLTGNYKKSRLGQYFTPPELCDMMAQMIIEPNDFGKKVGEPCSGSGRMVLAADHIAKGNYYVCQDKDLICAKMTAINLAMHGIKAEVHCMDTIRMNDLRASYYINYEYWKLKTPHIVQKKSPSY